VVSENARVKEAATALKVGKLKEFGQLMFDSHKSLKELYEVSGIELDTIVEFCKSYGNCLGARMTGAGFGGCAIALVRKDSLDDFSFKLGEYYSDKIGYMPTTFPSDAADGVRELWGAET
jgi:galactokinase